MITRASRKLETTFVSVARQGLPRPARYSTPSKRVSAPALAHAPMPAPDFPAYMPVPGPSSSSSTPPLPKYGVSAIEEMQAFLRRPQTFTTLPTPVPDGEARGADGPLFMDTPTQDRLSVVDACLHGLHDVPRAKTFFDLLRHERKGDPLLAPRLYNTILHAYLRMAEREDDNRALWVEEIWVLYDAMQKGLEGDKVQPTAGTYAVMLLCWIKFNPDSATPIQGVQMEDEKALLRAIVDAGIDLKQLLGDRSFATTDEAAAAIRLLSRAAVELNLPGIVAELGAAAELGTVDPALEGVPDVVPVRKRVLDPTAEAGAEPETVIPFNLEKLREHLGRVSFARQVLPGDPAARQKLLEESVLDVAQHRLQREAETLSRLQLGPQGAKSKGLQIWMWEWHQALAKKLKEDVPKLVREERKSDLKKLHLQRERLGEFLTLMKPETLSLIVIMELIRLQSSGGVVDGMKTARALITVGKCVEDEYKGILAKKANVTINTDRGARAPDQGFFSERGYDVLHQRRVAAARFADDTEQWSTEWSQHLRVKVGSFLVDALMTVAHVDVTKPNKRTGADETLRQPAFFHAYEYQKGHKLGVIKLNPIVSERLAKDGVRETLHPRHLPMLVKPKPWLAHNVGGYLHNPSSAMRFKESREQQDYLAKAAAAGHVELVFAGLDVLGATPWVVNRDVFEVVLEVWNSGRRLGKMPPAEYDGVEPEKTPDVDADPQKRSVFQQRLKAHIQAKAANHSDRCSVNYKIEIARAFLGDTFYLPHNLDFRGRAYPIPPHLNHIGDDLSRGLLLFAEKRPLGARGLRWLKIHLSNLVGFDKASFDERVNYVHEHLADVYDSAERPLTGAGWWQKADDPWQCLATCIELRKALESPDPLAFESSLPVHQDGTCNGLQHYAALGGDAQGARQVNLDVTDRPSDVYTFVANMVEAEIAKDLAKGEHKIAGLLAGRVARKVVKQTVMTTVYGVTFIGARDQIDRQLKARGEIPEEETWAAASYLARKVLFCIGDLFRGAKSIQVYLNLLARLVSKSIAPERLAAITSAPKGDPKAAATRLAKEQMQSMIWTTPLGLPIVQPYRKTKRRQVMTKLQSVFISDPNTSSAVNSAKQASAFPPNFVHSLDATHMMLTALECRSQGLTFASVHDSYWTHASTIDAMSAIIRDTFITLHSADVLGRLRDEIEERFAGYKVPAAAVKGTSLAAALNAHNAEVRAARVAAGLPADEVRVPRAPAPDADADEPATLAYPVADAAAAEAALAAAAAEAGESVDAFKAETGAAVVVLPGGAAEVHVPAKFVDLVSVLPLLPVKGSFDVATIKGSDYFFS